MRTPGSGRKPGSKNKDKTELLDICEKYGVSPFEGAVKLAHDETDPDKKFDKFMKLCPYLYAQKRSTEISNKDDEGFIVVVKDYSEPK